MPGSVCLQEKPAIFSHPRMDTDQVTDTDHVTDADHVTPGAWMAMLIGWHLD